MHSSWDLAGHSRTGYTPPLAALIDPARLAETVTARYINMEAVVTTMATMRPMMKTRQPAFGLATVQCGSANHHRLARPLSLPNIASDEVVCAPPRDTWTLTDCSQAGWASRGLR
jgi:hypothetical protein